MLSRMKLWGAGLAVAVIAAGGAQAEDRRGLPAGSYEVAQVTDPQVYALEEQVRQLNGKIEELTFQLLQLQEQLRKTQEDNEFRFQELEKTDRTDAGGTGAPARTDTAQAPAGGDPAPEIAAGPAPGSSTERGMPPRDLGTLKVDEQGNVLGGTVDFSENQIKSAIDGQAVASVESIDDPEELYRQGYSQVLNGDYNVAEGVFRSFLELFPGDALAGDAQFWLAESVRGQGRLEEAVEIYIAVRKAHPDSQKAPETLLKIGEIMAALGDRDVACVTFDDAEASYPSMSETVRTRIREERAKAKC
jgi:tol-pal system protein YbgF